MWMNIDVPDSKNINFESDKSIIVYFPVYTSGKFIINCLSQSDQTIPLSDVGREITQPLLDTTSKLESYKLRDELIASTIPPEDQLKQWGNYELSDVHLYLDLESGAIYHNSKDDIINMLTSRTNDITNSGKYFFIIAHDAPHGQLSLFPNASIIIVENYQPIQDIALRIKFDSNIDSSDQILRHGRPQELKFNNVDFEFIEQFERNGGTVNRVNMSKIFEFNEWALEIQKLYKVYDLIDFDENRLHTYWKAYMDLHQ